MEYKMIDKGLSEGLSEDETRSYVQNVVSDFTEEIRLLESFKGTQNIVSIEDFKVKEKTDLFGWDVYISKHTDLRGD